MLHAWQRKCFAHDTRQTKTRRKKIKRSDLSDAEKSSKLDDLRQFDPAIWPSDNFKRIKKELKKRRSSAVEEELQRRNRPAIQAAIPEEVLSGRRIQLQVCWRPVLTMRVESSPQPSRMHGGAPCGRPHQENLR
ncbi:unnamed protein product, partial [Tilletia controversa]